MKSFKRNFLRGLLFIVSLLVLLIACIVWLPTTFNSPPDFSNAEAVKKFDEQVDHLRAELEIPGLSLAVIEGAEVVHSNFYGYKNAETLEPVTENTLFEICSLSKMYQVYATMLLSQEGIIDLNEPLYKTKVHEGISYDERYKLITPRMVLNHTSGLENWIEFYDPNKLEIVADPGTAYEYSGEGYNYLADVTELITGKSYPQLVDSLVLNPLGIKDKTAYYLNPNKVNISYTNGHKIDGKPFLGGSTELSPASSICTNAESYAKMLLSLFSTDMLNKESLEYVLQEEIRLLDMPDYNISAYISNGFIINEIQDNILVVFFGSNTGYKSQILYSLSQKRGVVYLTNTDAGDLFARRINDLTFQFPIYNHAVYNDYRSLEMFSVYRNASTIKNERRLFDKIFDRSETLAVSDLWTEKNFVFLIIEVVLLASLLALILLSFLKYFVRKKGGSQVLFLLNKSMGLVRNAGVLYLFLWTMYALFDSEAEIYNPLLFFLILIGLFSQLFWFKWIQELAVARFVLPLLIILLLLVPSGIFVPSLELKGIQYIQDEFALSFNSFHLIGVLISLMIMTILYLRKAPKTS